MNMSLDEIIIQRKFPKSSLKGRGGLKRLNVKFNQNKQVNIKSKADVGRGGRSNSHFVGDARNRIIQKNRQKMTDARDRLGELAKTTDARVKLEKLKETRLKRAGISREIGNNQALSLKSGIRRGQGRGGFNSAPNLSRTINRPVVSNWSDAELPSLMDMDVDVPLSSDVYVSGGGMALRRTVNNDFVRPQPIIRAPKLQPASSRYTWTAPKVTTPATYVDLDYPIEEKRVKIPSQRILTTGSDDEDMELVRVSSRPTRVLSAGILSGNARVNTDMKSRLDTSRIAQPGIAATPAVPTGYRIIVSNLQASVTHDDIRELFEDVGPLQTSHLVRPGTAEVVYKQYKDAVQAVEHYHNRLLDGQPMKCLLVKPRRTVESTAIQSNSIVRSSTTSSHKSAGAGKSSIVPDISTIHKALFNK